MSTSSNTLNVILTFIQVVKYIIVIKVKRKKRQLARIAVTETGVLSAGHKGFFPAHFKDELVISDGNLVPD